MELAGQFATWFIIFVIYSMVGWLMEVIASIVMHGRPINRGFLIGPLCPIYGVGALIITLLTKHVQNIMTVSGMAEIFVISFLAGAILEYLTSYVMEKLFRVRWWDYSQERLNINGRVCLRNLISFGVLGILVVCFINPALVNLFNSIDETFRIVLAVVILLTTVVDLTVSLHLIIGYRVTVGTTQRDATEEITQHVREVMMGKSKLNRRLVNAFPNMEAKQKKPRSKSTKPKTKKKSQGKTSKTTKTSKTKTAPSKKSSSSAKP